MMKKEKEQTACSYRRLLDGLSLLAATAAAPWLEGQRLLIGVECGAVQIFTGQVMGNVHLPREILTVRVRIDT